MSDDLSWLAAPPRIDLPHDEVTLTTVMNAPGKVGRYRVTGVIGEGEFGVVYQAADPARPRTVAVKLLHQPAPRGERAAQAFAVRLREQASTVARLSHPGLVAIHEIDEHDGRTFIAMEHVAGPDLARWISTSRLPSQAVVLQMMDQLLDALDWIHRTGMRHGDVKPSNLLVTGAAMLKLTDFGLSRAQRRVGARAGVAPEYLTPGRPLDHRVDLYAAGAVLYLLLTGRDPFASGASPLAAQTRPPSTFADACRPAAFDAVVATAMARDPGDRYASATDFRDALAAASEQRLPAHGARMINLAPREVPAAPPAVAPTPMPAPAARPALPDAFAVRRALSKPAGAPPMTIAINDRVLDMPAYDPWLRPLAGGLPAAGPAHESALFVHETQGDDAYRAFEEEVERERRHAVAAAAAAASAALTTAADTPAAPVAAQEAPGRSDAEARAEPPLQASVRGLVITGAVSVSAALRERALPNGAAERLAQAGPQGGSAVPDLAPMRLQMGEGEREAGDTRAMAGPGEDIPDEALRRAMRILASHCGALAAAEVLKRVAGLARTIPELHSLLVEHAGDNVDTRTMARQLQAMSRLPL